ACFLQPWTPRNPGASFRNSGPSARRYPERPPSPGRPQGPRIGGFPQLWTGLWTDAVGEGGEAGDGRSTPVEYVRRRASSAGVGRHVAHMVRRHRGRVGGQRAPGSGGTEFVGEGTHRGSVPES